MRGEGRFSSFASKKNLRKSLEAEVGIERLGAAMTVVECLILLGIQPHFASPSATIVPAWFVSHFVSHLATGLDELTSGHPSDTKHRDG